MILMRRNLLVVTELAVSVFNVGCFCRVDPSSRVAPARRNHRTVAQDVGAKIQLRQDDLQKVSYSS